MPNITVLLPFPDFEELEDNITYHEREDEFDEPDETEVPKGAPGDPEEDLEIDIVGVTDTLPFDEDDFVLPVDLTKQFMAPDSDAEEESGIGYWRWGINV